MRLPEFILQHMEAILVDWEAFAATRLPAARHMRPLALRNDAPEILGAIALDMTTAQTAAEQVDKSKGLSIVAFEAAETAAQTHAILRARSGFDINQLAAEYRALRASVLRQWSAHGASLATDFEDMIRFNEAVDQALAESVSFFSAHVEMSRNLLLGILGHDLRSPLQTIHMIAGYLNDLNASDEVSVAASRLMTSGQRMQALVDDLLDFNRTKLGLGIPVNPADVDLACVLRSQVDQVRAAYPKVEVTFDSVGDCRGRWDPNRLQQLLDNLILNAIKYGSRKQPVVVALIGEPLEVKLEVRNSGPVIDETVLQELFTPLRRGTSAEGQRSADTSLGLGLYIAREIAKAHGGTIEVRSSDTQTVFVVTLPRQHSQ